MRTRTPIIASIVAALARHVRHATLALPKAAALGAAALLFATVGCATSASPQNHRVNSESAIRAAETVGAQDVPSAALHLQLAREQVELAEKSMRQGNNERAVRLLRRATADADLAVALAQEAPIRHAAEETLQRLEDLKAQSVQ